MTAEQIVSKIFKAMYPRDEPKSEVLLQALKLNGGLDQDIRKFMSTARSRAA